jgi:anaerobic selenocysteine-containing dehydrogenase
VGSVTDAKREVRSYCRICAAACGILVTVEGEHVQRVRGDPEHPVSRGYTCPKGRALPDWHHGAGRLDVPTVHGTPTTWDDALDDLAGVLGRAVEANGPDAFGAYLATGLAYDISGWMTTERLLRRVGTRQRYTPVTVDNAPVLRAAELVTGTSELNTVWDPDRSRLLLLFGTNPVVSHGYGTTLADPVTRLRDFRARGGRLWVLDPRRTETAALADVHVPIRPGTDHQVLAWLVRELLVEGADDDELTRHSDPDDVERLTAAVAPFDTTSVAAATGVGSDVLRQLLDDVRAAGRLAAMCGTGVTMSRDGVVAEWLRWVLLIVTGSADRIDGMRCNQGWLFPLDDRDWATMRRSAKPPEPGPSSRPDVPRWLGQHPCVALADEIERGSLRVLLVAGGNPLTAFPDPDRTRAALRHLDALVVLDVAASEISALATHVLPVAGQLERADVSMLENVSFANGSQHTSAVVVPAAQRRPAWWVVAHLARRLGLDVLGGADPDACTDDDVLRGIAAGSRGGYDALVAAGPHGVRAPDRYGWVHEHVLANGRWNLAPPQLTERFRAMPAADAGLVLAPRRRVRSMNSARYVAPADSEREPADIRMHPADVAEQGLTDAGRVVVHSAHGALEGVLRADATVSAGVVSCTHGDAGANVGRLTSASVDVDPDTGMPRASGVAVTVRAAAGPVPDVV